MDVVGRGFGQTRSPAQTRLRNPLLFGMIGQFLGVLGLILVWRFTNHDPWILALAGILLYSWVMAVWDLLLVDRNQLRRAMMVQLFVNWTVAIACTAIVPIMLPCFVAVVFLGAIVSVPYLYDLPRHGFPLVLAASSAVVLSLAAFGEFENWTHITAGMPHWLPGLIVMLILPWPVVYSAALLWNYRSTLIDTEQSRSAALDEAKASQRQLFIALAEARAHQQRLVNAEDNARRGLERDLHDGAQQSLTAIIMRAQAGEYPRPNLVDDLRELMRELRDLAHGIYPPVLEQHGLGAALADATRLTTVPVRLEGGDVGRFAGHVETTVYFCVREALQNVAKHARTDAKATVRVWRQPATLHFEISDDGTGFDVATTGEGAGLRNMRDRVGAVGGALDVQSRPGRGTTVRGVIPV